MDAEKVLEASKLKEKRGKKQKHPNKRHKLVFTALHDDSHS